MPEFPTHPIQGKSPDDLDWLSGYWQGSRGSDYVEEIWSEPHGGTLMGMFRWLAGDQVRFYELLVIEPEGPGVVMRIKHFSPGLVGWEAKEESVELDLVSLEERKAVFIQRGRQEVQWLVYHIHGEHRLISYFARPSQETPTEDQFRFTRMI